MGRAISLKSKAVENTRNEGTHILEGRQRTCDSRHTSKNMKQPQLQIDRDTMYVKEFYRAPAGRWKFSFHSYWKYERNVANFNISFSHRSNFLEILRSI
jgi:hypothetical protein